MVRAMWMRGLWIGELFLILFLLTFCSPNREFITIKIAGESFHVEVARTQQQQSKGLMSRETLGERQGMLFAYSEDRRLGFWMKDTSIPLSIAFVNRLGEIVQIEKMRPFDPTTVRSKISVRYALEVLEGTFERLGVKEGDRVEFPEGFR